jgi:hypothetical protein
VAAVDTVAVVAADAIVAVMKTAVLVRTIASLYVPSFRMLLSLRSSP